MRVSVCVRLCACVGASISATSIINHIWHTTGDKEPKASLLSPLPPAAPTKCKQWAQLQQFINIIAIYISEPWGEGAACVHSIIISARLALTRLDSQLNKIDSQRHLWIISPPLQPGGSPPAIILPLHLFRMFCRANINSNIMFNLCNETFCFPPKANAMRCDVSWL